MTERSGADCEMAIVLPLGVVASQLQRVEAQLRVLNMKAIDYARAHEESRVPAAVEAKLEQIHEALESIRVLVADIEADLTPRSRTSVSQPSTTSETVSAPPRPANDVRVAVVESRAERIAAKPRPVLDD